MVEIRLYGVKSSERLLTKLCYVSDKLNDLSFHTVNLSMHLALLFIYLIVRAVFRTFCYELLDLVTVDF